MAASVLAFDSKKRKGKRKSYSNLVRDVSEKVPREAFLFFWPSAVYHNIIIVARNQKHARVWNVDRISPHIFSKFSDCGELVKKMCKKKFLSLRSRIYVYTKISDDNKVSMTCWLQQSNPNLSAEVSLCLVAPYL